MKTMTKKQFREFQEEHGLTIEQMAEILMLSKESVYKRRIGAKKVSPRDQRLMEMHVKNIVETSRKVTTQ